MTSWLFAYGSLMSAASAARTLGREPHVVPVILSGWQRDFDLRIYDHPAVYACVGCGGGVPLTVALDCQPSAGQIVNGVLIEVTPDELGLLDGRELHYDRVALSAWALEGDVPAAGDLYVYRGKPQFRGGLDGHVLPSSYVEVVSRAAASVSPEFAVQYSSTSSEPSCPVRACAFVGAEAKFGADCCCPA